MAEPLKGLGMEALNTSAGRNGIGTECKGLEPCRENKGIK